MANIEYNFRDNAISDFENYVKRFDNGIGTLKDTIQLMKVTYNDYLQFAEDAPEFNKENFEDSLIMLESFLYQDLPEDLYRIKCRIEYLRIKPLIS